MTSEEIRALPHKVVNGEPVLLTAQELADRATEEAGYEVERAAREALAKRASVDAVRDAALLEGVEWSGLTWHTDPMFQVHITGIVAAFTAGILPEGATVAIRAKDNTVHQLNAQQCAGLAGAVMVKVQQVYAESWAAKDALN